jgi:predicted nucleotidyltransferase
MKYGLSGTTLQTLRGFFEKYSGIQKVILYGSRAAGNYRSGSDIDITLKTGDGFTSSDLWCLKSDLEESSLPYLFDVSIFEQLGSPNLKDHINRVGRVLYEKQYALP